MASAVPPAHPLEVREKAFRLYKDGKTNKEISEALNVPVKTLRNWSSSGRWKERSRLLIQHKVNPNEEKERRQIVLDNIAERERVSNMTLSERQAEFEERAAVQAMRIPKILEEMPDAMFIAGADKIAKMMAEARKSLKLEKDKPSVIINVGLLSQPVAAKPLPMAVEVSEPALLEEPEVVEAELVPDTDTKNDLQVAST